MSIEVKTTADVGTILEKVSDKLDSEMAKHILKAANYAGGVISEKVKPALPGGTGTLASSFLPAVLISSAKGSVSAGALSDLPYAGVQNRGGDILPKNKMLAIPISSQAKWLWPRDWPEKYLTLIENKNTGKVLLIEAKSKKLKVHYKLQESVYLNPTYYLEDSEEEVTKNLGEYLEDDIQQDIDGALK